MKRLLSLALVVLLATVALVGYTPLALAAAAPAKKVEWRPMSPGNHSRPS